ncbi:MAG: monovalent cation/H(+) antiporter subunit G [Deltaproteobacteria bacterium]|nr:monovalent cation/H(+) antiporter subunit G [Deltaproteobacteria bacterium]
MRDTLVALLLGGGTFFTLVAAIGVVRMPDIYMRLSAASKASTLGASLILTTVALFFDSAAVTGKVVAIIAFTLLTAPVAAHMLGRAAYFSGVPLWEKSVRDELGTAGRWSRNKAGGVEEQGAASPGASDSTDGSVSEKKSEP